MKKKLVRKKETNRSVYLYNVECQGSGRNDICNCH